MKTDITFIIPENEWTPEQFGVTDEDAAVAVETAIVSPTNNGWQRAICGKWECTIRGMEARVRQV